MRRHLSGGGIGGVEIGFLHGKISSIFRNVFQTDSINTCSYIEISGQEANIEVYYSTTKQNVETNLDLTG